MKIGEYEGYTITVSNPGGMEKVRESWLGYVIEDQERGNNESKEDNTSSNNDPSYICNM